MRNRNTAFSRGLVLVAGSLVAIAISIVSSRQACAGSPREDTVVLFSHDDARKLRLTDEQWRHPPHARALSDGPNIVIRSPQVVSGDVPTIEAQTPINLVVIFEPRNSPVDMSSLAVEAHKGFFSKSLTDMLRPYIHNDSIEVSKAQIPAGKFLLDISIGDQAGNVTTATYRLKVDDE
jgi:hypothetical protein